ncbi:hypothetical protein Glove_248g5 [Diversispora epigaea]|uniref:BED-type domain-containing protein n=1 Tax=Diversispora epigaea TaxID=1348612 RepID=A0A397IAX1_9GLOM|nr:hypothetical protein Glove_248g5 [Diversispora epigaea]
MKAVLILSLQLITLFNPNSSTSLHREPELHHLTLMSNTKSKVWDYFTKPYGPPKSRKTKCHECENEFSYHGSTSSMNYHLTHKHNIDTSTNSVHVTDQICENQNRPLQLLNLEQKNADILFAESWFFDILDKILKINRNDKDNKDAIIIRGKFYLKMGKYKESIADSNKVLEIEPNNVKVLIRRGEAYLMGRKYEKSIGDLSRALKIEPNNINALIRRGVSYLKMGNYEETIADLSSAIKINPNDAGLLKNRGDSYRKIGKYEESIADLNKALEIETNNNVYILISRGKTYKEMKRYKESVVDLNKAIEIEPNNIKALRIREEMEIL